ncbi:MAG: class I tRNA ligase family protein [Firmicutes bacterium]|nr:class I tRNA ligase family protein [Bacillota bacterium]
MKPKSTIKFPKKAVVTAGMPYGNKELHFGHIGGVFVQADVFARFLRCRIGRENVIFVSGTDCYGSVVFEKHRQLLESGQFSGSVSDFVSGVYESQKATLEKYFIDVHYCGSSEGQAGDIHTQLSADIVNCLYERGVLFKAQSLLFFDTVHNVFLNGRQVSGYCPIAACKSEKGYADECSLGHQYFPHQLLEPKSELSGSIPQLREAPSWYFDLEKYREFLQGFLHRREGFGDGLSDGRSSRKGASGADSALGVAQNSRAFVTAASKEFLVPPSIFIKSECGESKKIVYNSLQEREEASKDLAAKGKKFRTSKTLVPFRISANLEWGVPFPNLDGASAGLTTWVWPESLWAPISFTKHYLSALGGNKKGEGANSTKVAGVSYKDFWQNKNAAVYQFIGEDNIYFYNIAQQAMFSELARSATFKGLVETEVIANKHLLFFGSKAASSGAVKPPMADELLSHYSAEHLRAHFFAMALDKHSVSFQPAALVAGAGAGVDTKTSATDPALKEWNVFANLLNRACRTLFNTFQKFHPDKASDSEADQIFYGGAISKEVKDTATKAVAEYERLMMATAFTKVMVHLENFFKEINGVITSKVQQLEAFINKQREWLANTNPDYANLKMTEVTQYLSKNKDYKKNQGGRQNQGDTNTKKQFAEFTKLFNNTIADITHLVKTATILSYPITPQSADKVRHQLNASPDLYCYTNIHHPLDKIITKNHRFKHLQPKTDFFPKA